jgi:hypothetical protein
VTNEQYLIVSYFAVAGGGVALAILTALVLVGPLGRALQDAVAPLAQILRRALPAWLILAAILGFLSVSYFDCAHKTYEDIVKDKSYLVGKNFEQGAQVCRYAAVALAAYAVALGLAIFAHARSRGSQRPV